MSFREIGQQLRAYRMESGLKAEEISAQLGISRAALYRYEKGEVIKLETVTRLADMLKISPLTLLGIGVEYYAKPASYAERLRALEEISDQILQFFGPVCYLLTSDEYDKTLSQIFEEHIASTATSLQTAQAEAEQLMSLMLTRKKTYQTRKPAVIALLTVSSVRRFLAEGLVPAAQVSSSTRVQARTTACHEMEQIACLMESEPLGLQLGLMAKEDPNGPFALFRSRDRASLALNLFAPDALATASCGVAMLTTAEDAVAIHQRAFEQVWPEAIKGTAAAQRIRELIMESRA